MRLSNATVVAITDAEAVGTIVDDDPVLTVADVSVTEGSGGQTPVHFTVSLSRRPVAGKPVTVLRRHRRQHGGGGQRLPASRRHAGLHVRRRRSARQDHHGPRAGSRRRQRDNDDWRHHREMFARFAPTSRIARVEI